MHRRYAMRRRGTVVRMDADALIKDNVASNRKRDAFTLIELFVVIAIIAILVVILMPAINSIVNQGKKTRVNAEVKSIVTAWQDYFNEYGRWPVKADNSGKYWLFYGVPPGPGVLQNANEDESTGMVMVVDVMTNIMYPNASMSWGGWARNMNPICTNFNPKREVFLTYNAHVLDGSGNLVDPWGKPYKFMFDLNRDRRVQRRALGSLAATSVYESVISWSTGPDGVESADDLNSWE